jgi:hypothetical protein
MLHIQRPHGLNCLRIWAAHQSTSWADNVRVWLSLIALLAVLLSLRVIHCPFTASACQSSASPCQILICTNGFERTDSMLATFIVLPRPLLFQGRLISFHSLTYTMLDVMRGGPQKADPPRYDAHNIQGENLKMNQELFLALQWTIKMLLDPDGVSGTSLSNGMRAKPIAKKDVVALLRILSKTSEGVERIWWAVRTALASKKSETVRSRYREPSSPT